MTRRLYRESATLEERLSSEFQRLRSRGHNGKPVAQASAINEDAMDDLEERRKRASAMAGDTIDGISDVSASREDQANRKRSLLEGPDEFRIVRMDRARAKLG
jgi:hypothetical protein